MRTKKIVEELYSIATGRKFNPETDAANALAMMNFLKKKHESKVYLLIVFQGEQREIHSIYSARMGAVIAQQKLLKNKRKMWKRTMNTPELKQENPFNKCYRFLIQERTLHD